MEQIHNISDACPNAVSGTTSQLFLTLVQALISSRCSFNTDYPPDYSPQLTDGDEFDFIIVGAGSAGSVLANRLSEVTQWKILVLEAGTYPSTTSEIPALYPETFKTKEDWDYHTEGSCLGLKDQRCEYPRGKVLGGSSSINAMMYVRSTKQDHDDWVKADNSLWDYETVLKHYRKIELDLQLNHPKKDIPIKAKLREGYRELGYPQMVTGNSNGYGDIELTIKNGARLNTAKAFLTNNRKLHLALKAHVTKLTLNHYRATGVEVLINNHLIRLTARKEVILSAGSINTPQILMLSGIGPEEHLVQLGIPVKKSLRVGENLQDHVIFMGVFFNVDSSAVPPALPTDNLDAIYNYLVHRKGNLLLSPLHSFHLHINTKNISQDPNLQINHFVFQQNNPDRIEAAYPRFNFVPEMVQLHLENNKKSSGLQLFPKALVTKSRGKLMLHSTDPLDKPLIYPNYFQDGEDVEVLLDGVKIIKNLINTETFKKINAQLVDLQVKDCKHFEFDTDDYWRCAIRSMGHHLHHPSGTCKMGPKSDPGAVVDQTLKVYGISGLRVVDASVMPIIPRCNTNAPAMMIADRVADFIKKEWLKLREEL